VAANNPAMVGYTNAMQRNPGRTMMDGTSDMQDRLLLDLLSPQGYWRFQAELGACNFAMDDASAANVACLRQVGERLVGERDEDLRTLAASLMR
jgi:hypothetical protein